MTLKSLLSGKYSFGAGSSAGVNNTLALKLANGSEYRAWFNTKFHALNLQSKEKFEQQEQGEKIGLGLGADGSILSIRLDNEPLPSGETLPDDRVQVIFLFISPRPIFPGAVF